GRPIKLTTERTACRQSAWRLNPGRRSTYRSGNSVRTTGATSYGRRRKKGMVKAGMLAVLAILSADYMKIPAEEISTITSELTLLGGRPVFGKGQFAGLSPKPLPVTPNWLPIKNYPSYRTADAAASGKQMVAACMADAALPEIIGPDGGRWSMGCLCGLI
ncbi:MAG: amidohydrolase family protein, partial [Rhodomicrobium sp.]